MFPLSVVYRDHIAIFECKSTRLFVKITKKLFLQKTHLALFGNSGVLTLVECNYVHLVRSVPVRQMSPIRSRGRFASHMLIKVLNSRFKGKKSDK